MKRKLLDIILKVLQNEKQKKAKVKKVARKGNSVVIEPYDYEKDKLEQIQEAADRNRLPHPF